MNKREKIRDVIVIVVTWLTAIGLILLVIAKLRFKLLYALLLFVAIHSTAQDSTGKLNISGYIEVYYSYDFNKPVDHNRPGFVYSHNRHNECNVNLALLKASYTSNKVRANFSLAAGTYMNANYAAEPATLKNIYEANAGVKLGRKNLWIDGGILPSHIGFESAIGKDCWNLTRSILADNTPYFEAGAKLTYTSDNGKWILSGLALNGWQRITRVNGNSLMSWGTQIQFKPTSKILLNSSTFIGTDKPDSIRLKRFFHNFYGIFNMTDKFGITAGFDFGIEEKAPYSNNYNNWYSPVVILKYNFSDKWIIAARGEYYIDSKSVIIAPSIPNGFSTAGFSFNVDHIPAKNVLVRLEFRNFNSRDTVFIKASRPVKQNAFITSSLIASF